MTSEELNKDQNRSHLVLKRWIEERQNNALKRLAVGFERNKDPVFDWLVEPVESIRR